MACTSPLWGCKVVCCLPFNVTIIALLYLTAGNLHKCIYYFTPSKRTHTCHACNGPHPQVNLECKCNKWEETKPEGYPAHMNPAPDLSPNDGWLVIVNREIMCGVMDKATVGSGRKKSVFGVIMRDYGAHEASAAMNRLSKLCARWLVSYFHSCQPSFTNMSS